MLELEEAQARIFAAIQPLPAETVPLHAAAGRVAAEPITATIHLPSFDNSAMDGYAVQARDLASATEHSPGTLALSGQVRAGEKLADPLQPGTCVRIFTGSPLPPGADAVVMQEDTRLVPEKPDHILFCSRITTWENVRLAGEDVKRGATVLAAGTLLNSSHLGLLASMGQGEIKASRRPAIGLLATGSELQEPGQPLLPGKIYESNRVSLAALLVRAGGAPKVYPLVPDTLSATQAALELAFSECDSVVTTGGVSVGEFDLVKKAFEQLGGELQFWQVAIKPGKPFVFGRWRDKFLFGLPGNPVSAWVTCLLLVRPALLHWQGAASSGLASHPGILTEPLVNRGDRRHFMRVRVDESGRVRSAGVQASHILSSLAEANGLADVPPQTSWEAGRTVPIIRWD